MPHTDDLLSQFLRLAAEYWPYLLVSLIGLLADKRGVLQKAIQGMAAASAKTRTEEHKAVNGNGNGAALRLAATNIESLNDDVREIRKAQAQHEQVMDKKFTDFQQTVLASVGAANTYTDQQLKQVRAEFDARFTMLDEIKKMLDDRLPQVSP